MKEKPNRFTKQSTSVGTEMVTDVKQVILMIYVHDNMPNLIDSLSMPLNLAVANPVQVKF